MIKGYKYSREQLELIIHNKRVYGLKVEQELIDMLNELKNKEKNMYSLDCLYYNKKFDSIDELIDDIASSGMDPNYEITRGGKGIGENAIDYMPF